MTNYQWVTQKNSCTIAFGWMESEFTWIRPSGEVPRPAFKHFANAEITNHQLLDQSFVLVGSVRIALKLQLVERRNSRRQAPESGGWQALSCLVLRGCPVLGFGGRGF